MALSEDPLESDWKEYNKHVDDWRERYMKSAIEEIVHVLKDDSKSPTDCFWAAKKKMAEQARLIDNCLGDYRRSVMRFNLFKLHLNGLISDSDLSGFSEQLRKMVSGSARDRD